MSGPEKSGHVIHGAILFPRLLMHSRQKYAMLCLSMQQRSEKGFHMHKSLKIIHRENVMENADSRFGWKPT